MVKSNLILGDTPKAVANLKIVQITDVLFFLEIIYFSASTFALAYRDKGFKGLFSS